MIRPHRAAVIAALTIAAIAPVASTAHATVSITAAVPSCVKAVKSSHGVHRTVTVTNRCSRTYRVKIAWNNRPDGPCRTLAPGPSYSESKNSVFGHPFQRLKSC